MESQQKISKESIEVAVDLFKQYGFYHVALSNISSKYAINLSYLHITIDDKIAYAIAAMDYVQDIFDSEILVCVYDEAITTKDRIIKLNNNIKEYFINSKGGCIFVNFCLEGIREHEGFKEPIERYFKSLNEAYRYILSGIYTPAEAQIVADEFVADLQGALIMMRVTGESLPIQRLSERFLEHWQPETRRYHRTKNVA
jgi:TetR/AcrR family transcriptional repressor of nem operon